MIRTTVNTRDGGAALSGDEVHDVAMDAGEPRNAPAAHMHGFLSCDGLPPATLLDLGRAEIDRYGVDIVRGRVEHVEPGYDMRLEGGPVMDDQGWVVTDRTGRTSVPGVWAVGNVVDPRAQVIAAAGMGSTAAFAINTDLLNKDVEDAIARHRATAAPA